MEYPVKDAVRVAGRKESKEKERKRKEGATWEPAVSVFLGEHQRRFKDRKPNYKKWRAIQRHIQGHNQYTRAETMEPDNKWVLTACHCLSQLIRDKVEFYMSLFEYCWQYKRVATSSCKNLYTSSVTYIEYYIKKWAKGISMGSKFRD
uniref:Uncharacterized protein n=1 Tax=Molossus molossus TaxID=27622 RepID=A0A7J8BJD9_MOLMO|nr:hypothetical protein HJG59_010444 [Molossus molossus]